MARADKWLATGRKKELAHKKEINMLLSFKQAMMLFRKWHRDYSWIYVQARLDDKDIEYLFWVSY